MYHDVVTFRGFVPQERRHWTRVVEAPPCHRRSSLTEALSGAECACCLAINTSTISSTNEEPSTDELEVCDDDPEIYTSGLGASSSSTPVAVPRVNSRTARAFAMARYQLAMLAPDVEKVGSIA